MPQTHDQWEAAMIRQFGSVEAGREEMKRRRALKGESTKPGGFAYLKQHDPERLKKIQDKAIKSRWRGNVPDDSEYPNSN